MDYIDTCHNLEEFMEAIVPSNSAEENLVHCAEGGCTECADFLTHCREAEAEEKALATALSSDYLVLHQKPLTDEEF